ncbi:MAG: hypothetical protein ABJH05_04835 [Fulvivirga sp.]
MTAQQNKGLSIALTFLWIGFVCAISFMEAWLKFQAPEVTLSIGLGIGRLVFQTLNKIEWVFAIGIIITLIACKTPPWSKMNVGFYVGLVVLLLQTAWLLPQLDDRARQVISGVAVAHSNAHFYYIGLEILKVLGLITFGINLFKNDRQSGKILSGAGV